jgi:uncharacterized protein with HEPN domain
MTERQKKYLSDILSAINLIEDFVRGINTFKEFENDLKSKSAVERQLSIIGEALKQFTKEDSSEIIQHSDQIVSLRNRLVHAYDSIDDTIIWSIVKTYLKPLKEEVENLLKSKG